MPASRIENLARLSYSLRDEYVSPSQRQFLLRQCLNDLPEPKVDEMIKKILRRDEQLRHRRNQPVY
jgi:DNA polymerase III delta subunit